jgi:hypothetical protein
MHIWKWALACLVLAGCERIVTVDAPEGPVRLVVEARLERVKGDVTGNQSIRLTTTSPYFANGIAPAAHGALVRVTDETGAVVTFPESAASPGTYTTTALVGVIGRQYTLSIDFAGQHYESTERMNAVPAIDSLYFALPETGAMGPTDGMRATINLRDPRGAKNW